MKQVENVLLALVRAAISGDSIDLDEQLSDEVLNGVLELAGQHSLAPLVLDTLLKYNLISDKELAESCRGVLFASVVQQQRQSYEQKKISEIFEESQIPYIHLKGSVMRNYYPEPWQRTCCDVDVLVKNEDLEKARHKLEENGYKFYVQGSHDVSMFSPGGINIELHYHTIEKERAGNSNQVLDDIWSYSRSKNGGYECELFDEMFYFYHIAHMAKHFIHGGCGVRPFLDLWLINKNMSFDNEKKMNLLKQGGILTFAETVENLANVWFSDGEYTNITRMMENYIFEGGVYGNLENQIAMSQAKTDSKIKSAWSKVFLDYNTIKFHYPILQKYKCLLPFMEIRRWCKLIFFKEHRKRSINHLNANQKLSDEQKKQVKELRDYLGI